MIHVVAVITAKPGERAAILDAFRANVPAVLAEDGCIEYSAVIDTANGPAFQTPAGPDTFMVTRQRHIWPPTRRKPDPISPTAWCMSCRLPSEDDAPS